MLWGQTCAACSALPQGCHAVIHSMTPVWPSGFIVGWISVNLKVNWAVQIPRLPFDSAIRQCPCAGVYFGGSHDYRYLPCGEFAWGKSMWVTEHPDCVWYKKLNFFHSTQWVKVWGNFISSSLWKMLFYPPIKMGLPVFVVVLSSNFRDQNVNMANRHSKLRVVGGIMLQPNLSGSKHGLISANAPKRKT